MKKLTALMIGLSLALGTAAFAQDDTKKMDDKKMEKKTKKTKKAKKPAADATADKKM